MLNINKNSSSLRATELAKAMINAYCCTVLERFSFECRKVIGFVITTLRDWLKKLAPLFHSIISTTKTTRNSRALHQLHVITSSFDWSIVFSVSFLIG